MCAIYGDLMTKNWTKNNNFPQKFICTQQRRFCFKNDFFHYQQGKSEGFDSCDRPSNLTQIGFKSSIFQPVWPWNLMDDPKNNRALLLCYFKLFASFLRYWWIQTGVTVWKRLIWVKIHDFLAVWPCSLTDDLEKQYGTSSMLLQTLCIIP